MRPLNPHQHPRVRPHSFLSRPHPHPHPNPHPNPHPRPHPHPPTQTPTQTPTPAPTPALTPTPTPPSVAKVNALRCRLLELVETMPLRDTLQKVGQRRLYVSAIGRQHMATFIMASMVCTGYAVNDAVNVVKLKKKNQKIDFFNICPFHPRLCTNVAHAPTKNPPKGFFFSLFSFCARPFFVSGFSCRLKRRDTV